MAEECIDPSITIPFGIVTSISVCVTVDFVLLVVTMFSIQTYDIEGHVFGSKVGQRMAQIIYDAFETGPGQNDGDFLYGLVSDWPVHDWCFRAYGNLKANFAFAGDNGLPMSRWVKQVHARLAVLIYALRTGGILAIVVGLLCLSDPRS